jgi:hypothetical protein
LIVFFLLLVLVTSCRANYPTPGDQWKTFRQLKADLRAITKAGFTRVCLFDLQSIRDHPDSRYISFLTKYAEKKDLEITVYVQSVEPDQDTLNLAQSIGASSVIVYDEELVTLFREAGIRTTWWSGTAYPPNHFELQQYMGWPDLRSEQVRQEIADWAVQTPKAEGGLSLDYIRWNEVGNGRNAEQVTDLLRRIRTNWDMNGNGALSAAVFPYLGRSRNDGGALSVGQKWDEWLKDDLVDFVYPMAYNSEDISVHLAEWESYDTHRVVPCLSVIDYDGR